MALASLTIGSDKPCNRMAKGSESQLALAVAETCLNCLLVALRGPQPSISPDQKYS